MRYVPTNSAWVASITRAVERDEQRRETKTVNTTFTEICSQDGLSVFECPHTYCDKCGTTEDVCGYCLRCSAHEGGCRDERECKSREPSKGATNHDDSNEHGERYRARTRQVSSRNL